MNYFGNYFIIQLKRIKKLLPGIMLMIFALLVLLIIAAYAVINDGYLAKEQKRYSLGLVGQVDSSLLRTGVYLLENEDSSKEMIELKEYDDAEDAKSALRTGEISAYIVITDEFLGQIDSLENGEKLKYYGTSGQKGITGVMMDEIAAVAGNIIVYTEKGILSFDQVLRENNQSDQDRILQITDLFNAYVEAIMARDSLVEFHSLGMSDGLSTPAYYFSTLTLFLMMMIPFCGIWIFLGERDAAARFFASKGLNPTMQVIAEMLAFYLFNLFGQIFVIVMLAIFEWKFQLRLGDFLGIPGLNIFMLPTNLFFPTLMFSAMGFFFLDVLQGVVNKVLVTFILDILMAYLSGYFYPRVFFPELMQKVSSFLPSGAALSLFINQQTSGRLIELIVILVGYTCIFIVFTILVRRSRVRL